MLNQGNKLIIIILFLFFSCSEKTNKKKLFFQTSMQIVKDNLYYKNYNGLNDSISNWYYKLPNAGFMKNGAWQIDSLICYNKEGDRFVTCLMCKCEKYNTCNADDLHFLYGAKINDNWYFFLGSTVYLPRNIYQKDTHTPLSFAKLHEIALKEIYGGYLNKEGQIDENWFDYMFKTDIGCSSCKTDADFNTYYLWLVNNNWKKHPDYKYTPETKPLP